MKDGPCLHQFHTRSGKEYKRLAAYLFGIFRKGYPESYLLDFRGTLLYHTRKYPRLWRTVPRLCNGLCRK